MSLFVGLDISLKKTSICVLNEQGVSIFQGTALSEPAAIMEKLSRWRDDIVLVGIEACPLSEWLHTALTASGYEVRCLETRHTQRFLSTRPNKTDRNDAHGIATMLRLGHFKPVHVKSRQAQLLRALLTGRRQVMDSMLRIENTIRGLLRVQGMKIGAVHRNQYSERVMTLCEDDPEVLVAVAPLLAARDTMRDQLKKLDLAVARQARHDPICALFMGIPGVGPITALAYKATIDDPQRFAKSKAVPAHLGLTPKVYQSGEIDRSGRISKSGDQLLRHLLTEAAASMLMRTSKWCALKHWGVKLAAKIGMGKAVVAVARKMAIIMHAMWLTGEVFRFGSGEPVPNTP